MSKGLAVGVCLSLYILLCSAGVSASEHRGTEVQILDQSADRLVFQLRLGSFDLRPLAVEGETYIAVSADGLVWVGNPGEPDLPVYTTFLAIPDDGDAILLTVSTADEEVYQDVRIVPVPRVVKVGEDPFYIDAYEYFENPEIYQSGSIYPSRIAWLAEPGILRDQKVIKLFLAPFVYDPSKSILRVIREIKVTVGFKDGGVGFERGQDKWEPFYRSLLLNYEQGRRWRKEPKKLLEVEPSVKAPAVTNQRLKMLIDRTGIHRLDYNVAQSAGFPSGLPIDQIFIYQDIFREGQSDTLVVDEVACEIVDSDSNGIFSQGDYIGFFAKNFYDQFGYREDEDMYFDKNIYWLSWGPGQHKRIDTKPGWRQSQPLRLVGFGDFIHVEKDSFFVSTPPLGTFDFFTWTRLRGSLRFDLPGLVPDYGAQVTANFIYQLPSYSGVGTIRVDLLIKDCDDPDFTQIHSFTIPGGGSSMTRRSAQISAGSLCETGNVFRFETYDATSGNPFTKSPGVMLDWFEISYMRSYRAEGNRLKFTSGDALGEIEIEVKGFSNQNILLYDITDPSNTKRIVLSPEQVSQDQGFFKVTFRDSIAGETSYYAVTADSFFVISPLQVSLRQPPRLRNQVGEYLVITHPDFFDALTPLVSRRQEKYTVVVATTEEVYDDFGNGMKSDKAIKRMIKNGYSAGELLYVLLVGDSNVDRKGILLNPPPGDSQGASDIDYVPTHNLLVYETEESNYSVLPSDMWFACMHGESDLYPDIYIARLPVGSIIEAQGAINKILRFEASEEAWKRRLLLVADDEYKTTTGGLCWVSGDVQFKWACEDFARTAANAPVPPEVVNFYLEDCLRNDQPDLRASKSCVSQTQTINYTRSNCTPALLNLFENGAMLVKYSGHSNFQQFAHEQLIYDIGPKNYSYDDIVNLKNANRPFIFAGFGCWISNFHKRNESAKFMGDAIGEKFVINPDGGGCASLGSPKSEYISANRTLAQKLAQLIFENNPQQDPYGNLLAPRLVFGEIALNMLLYSSDPQTRMVYCVFGDPAMPIDLGPPAISVKINQVEIDTTYTFSGVTFDTLRIESEIKDEEAIIETKLEIVSAQGSSFVSPDQYSKVPLLDAAYPVSRAYRINYDHIPLLGTYSIRLTAKDYSSKVSKFEIGVSTGSVEFFAGGLPLAEGGQLLYGKRLLIRLSRPIAFEQDQISVFVDSIPGETFDGWDVKKRDAEGKQWEVSFIPRLEAGLHEIKLDVGGFKATRSFEFVPIDVVFKVGGMPIYDGDYISAGYKIVIEIKSGLPINPEEIEALIDGEPQYFELIADSTVVTLELEVPELEPGQHTLSIKVGDLETQRVFQIASEASLIDAHFYPNPFAGETYLTYILSMDAQDVKLSIYTVSGRLIYRHSLDTSTGYHEFRWDGIDLAGDRLANGIYLYKIEANWGKNRSQTTGWLVKIE